MKFINNESCRNLQKKNDSDKLHAEQSTKITIKMVCIPTISRKILVNDLKKVIGNIDGYKIPQRIKLALNNLLIAAEKFEQTGNQDPFFSLYKKAIQQCNKGWGVFGFWSISQSRCYSIYWGLKAAIAKYQRQQNRLFMPKNDPEPPPANLEKHAFYSRYNIPEIKFDTKLVQMHFYQQYGSKELSYFEKLSFIKAA